ncbi:MAG: hypothetical protein Q7K25_10015 [Actinomycetota bacterium]|nr:hypothetical protein [Actinomycetota bacterium]
MDIHHISIRIPPLEIDWIDKFIDFTSIAIATLAGALVGALAAGGFAWWVQKQDRKDARLAVDQDRWVDWAHELGDLSSLQLLEVAMEWRGAVTTLEKGQEAAALSAGRSIPAQDDMRRWRQAEQQLRNVSLRITLLSERMLRRPGSPSVGRDVLQEAYSRWARAFDSALRLIRAADPNSNVITKYLDMAPIRDVKAIGDELIASASHLREVADRMLESDHEWLAKSRSSNTS